MEITEGSDNFSGWDYSIYCVIMDCRFVVAPSQVHHLFKISIYRLLLKSCSVKQEPRTGYTCRDYRPSYDILKHCRISFQRLSLDLPKVAYRGSNEELCKCFFVSCSVWIERGVCVLASLVASGFYHYAVELIDFVWVVRCATELVEEQVELEVILLKERNEEASVFFDVDEYACDVVFSVRSVLNSLECNFVCAEWHFFCNLHILDLVKLHFSILLSSLDKKYKNHKE